MPAVRPLLLLWLCYGAMMSLAIAINLLPVFLTTLDSEFGGAAGLTQEQLGRLGGIAFAGLVVGIIITGPLADRCGAKPIVLIGDLMIAAGLAGTALAPSYVALAWGVFALGLGAGALDMVLSPVVAALAPDRRTAAMNWLHSFYGVGAVVTIAVATAAPWLGSSWRGACWALMPMPLGLLIAFSAMRFPALVGDGGRTPLAGLLRNRWFLAALIAILLGGATELGM
ncbi:MAG: MFS transporter, partial [Planctomycetes bacterium]|nr:MFS transporter [Planctomycetota bacterium]